MTLDLDAPIIPGHAAAGLAIGHPLPRLTDAVSGATASPQGVLRLDYGAVSVWTTDGMITQICVRAGYRGKLGGAIGIGSTIVGVEAYLGPVSEDPSDNLIVDGMPGWCFETEEWGGLHTLDENRDARITSICVYAINDDDAQL
jgi:hypothetical protein